LVSFEAAGTGRRGGLELASHAGTAVCILLLIWHVSSSSYDGTAVCTDACIALLIWQACDVSSSSYGTTVCSDVSREVSRDVTAARGLD